MLCDQYIISGPPNGPILFCSLASVGVYRLSPSVPLPAGGWPAALAIGWPVFRTKDLRPY